MDTHPSDRIETSPPEPEPDRRERLTWEADRIAEARAQLEAGLYVDADDVDAWVKSMGTDQELPQPRTRQR